MSDSARRVADSGQERRELAKDQRLVAFSDQLAQILQQHLDLSLPAWA